MKKPEELTELLESLERSVKTSSVLREDGACAKVYIGKGTLNLTAYESSLVFHSEATVDKFFEAIGSPDEASVELYSLALADEAKDKLEELFSTVDEM